MIPELQEDRDFLQSFAGAFTGSLKIDLDQLFDDDDENPGEQEELSLWDDVDWWTGEDKTAPTTTVFNTVATPKKTAKSFAKTHETDPQATRAELEGLPQARKAEVRWFQQENGKIPDSRLVEVKDLGRYEPSAARALKAMKRKARKDGIILKGGGYRSYEEQEGLQWKEDQLGIPVAEPGHSNHGWGTAADFDVTDPATFKWLQQNAGGFGWENPEWAQNGVEPWHWEYKGGYKGGDTKGTKPKQTQTKVTRKSRAREVGAVDLNAPHPLVGADSFENALLSLITDEPSVTRTRFKRKAQKVRGGAILKKLPRNARDIFRDAAKEYDLPVKLLVAVAAMESGTRDENGMPVLGTFDPKAVSSAGAQGAMQIMPLHGVEKPFNLRANVMAGARILASYMSGLGLRKGLAAYNAGPSNYQAGLGYADTILKLLGR